MGVGYIVEEYDYRVEDDRDSIPSLDGWGGIPDLPYNEIRLLSNKKLNDFGEKIGGSAKDRYVKGERKETNKGFEDRLPENREQMAKCKPTLDTFIDAGLNKLCALLCYFIYYDRKPIVRDTYFNIIDEWIKDKENQRNLLKNFIEYDSELTIFIDELRDRDKSCADFLSEINWNEFYNAINRALFTMKYQAEVPDFNIEIMRDFDAKTFIRHYNIDLEKDLFIWEYERSKRKELKLYLANLSSARLCVVRERKKRYSAGQYLKLEDLNKECKVGYENGFLKENALKAFIEGRERAIKAGWIKSEYFNDKEGLVAQVRKGKDYRNGRNVETFDFKNTFGFRAIEFGESMPQKERWDNMNNTYDAFMDLCDVLKIEPKMISLGGDLGLCFGSRGRGGKNAPKAHYEPSKNVINLTRRNGAGSLAHEWFHAFDRYIGEILADLTEHRFWGLYYLTDFLCRYRTDYYSSRIGVYNADWNIWEVMGYDAEKIRLLDSPFYTPYEKSISEASPVWRRSQSLESLPGYKKDYWTKLIEIGARCFEFYVCKEIEKKGNVSEYLVQIPPPTENMLKTYPYPFDDAFCEKYNKFQEETFQSQFFEFIFKVIKESPNKLWK